MSTWKFNPPANLKDFSDPEVWHNAMAAEARGIIILLVASVKEKEPRLVTQADIDEIAPLLAYVDPVASPPDVTAEIIAIPSWGAFPRAVERKQPWPFPTDPDDVGGIYRAVEEIGSEDVRGTVFRDQDGTILNLPVRHRQDEYLEWSVRRNNSGKISKISFVAEGYDYFSTLFDHDPKLVTEMYREFTEVNGIQTDDLRALKGIYTQQSSTDPWIEAGRFNPRNQFNINPGIVHLSHNANSLGAEVNLAGVSGVARKGVDGNTLPVGNAELLLCCSQGGNPNRNSDPLIGAIAYAQVIDKVKYTLADPVGLYMAGIEEARITTPSGEMLPREWWKVVRGYDLWEPAKSRVLRLELEVPKQEGFLVGDLLVDGNPVKLPGQIAQLLSVHLFVTRWKRKDDTIGPVIKCDGTCCRQTGKEHLVGSDDGGCDTGYELAFEGLVPNAPPVIPAMAEIKFVLSEKMKATLSLKSRL